MPSQYSEDVFEKSDIKEISRDRDMVRMVRSFMQRSSRYREPFLNLARKAREVYENWQPGSRSIIQRANLKLPFGFTVVETQLPQLVDIFFRDEEIFKFEGQDVNDAQFEHLITDFHKHQLHEMKIVPKSTAFIKSMLLDGTAIAKVPYRFKEIETVVRESSFDPTTGDTQVVKRPAFEVLFDGPDLEVLTIFDFYPDWSVKSPGDVQGMRGCVHRTWRTLASLKNNKVYKNLDQVEFSVKSKGPSAWAPAYFEDDNLKDDFEKLQDNTEQGIKDPGKIEIWEYWGLHDPNGTGRFEEWIITVANGDVVIRAERNFYDYKFKPFVACPNYIRDGEFYGIPELTALRSLIKEANTLRNARLDNINLSVNPMWLADRAAGVNVKSLYSRPNGIIWTNDMNGIKPMQLPDPSIGSKEEGAFLQSDIQNASGLINAAPAMGQLARTFGRSATGVNMINSFSQNRIGLKARLLSEYYFKPLAWIMLMTNRQFVTEDKWVRVSDPNAPNPFAQLPADAFFRKFDFVVSSDIENGGIEGQFQKMQAVAQVLQVAENSQPGTVRFDVLLEELLRPLVGRKIPRFVRDEQERSQLQAQQLAATQAVNAAQGAAAPQPNEMIDLSVLTGGEEE